MNGFKNQPILLWIVGAMLTVTLVLLTTIMSMGTGRLDRIESKVEAQQQQLADMQYKLGGVVWLLTRGD